MLILVRVFQRKRTIKRRLTLQFNNQAAGRGIFPSFLYSFVQLRPSADWIMLSLPHWREYYTLISLPTEISVYSGNMLRNISQNNVETAISWFIQVGKLKWSNIMSKYLNHLNIPWFSGLMASIKRNYYFKDITKSKTVYRKNTKVLLWSIELITSIKFS